MSTGRPHNSAPYLCDAGHVAAHRIERVIRLSLLLYFAAMALLLAVAVASVPKGVWVWLAGWVAFFLCVMFAGALFCGAWHGLWYLVWRTTMRPAGDRSGLCPNCGYDLRATPTRCPECGLPPWDRP